MITGSERCGHITITLIPAVEDELRRLTERTRLSATDLANRAITLYEFVDAQLRAGRDVLTCDHATGAAALVRLADAAHHEASPQRGAASPRSMP